MGGPLTTREVVRWWTLAALAIGLVWALVACAALGVNELCRMIAEQIA